MSGQRDEMAAVLAEHGLAGSGRNLGQYRTEWTCDCGTKIVTDGHKGERVGDGFNAHLADALLAAGFGPVRAVEAERDRLARINDENWAKLGGYVEAWGPLLARAESAEAALAGLREGVEALADKWEASPQAVAGNLVGSLRALLASTPDREEES